MGIEEASKQRFAEPSVQSDAAGDVTLQRIVSPNDDQRADPVLRQIGDRSDENVYRCGSQRGNAFAGEAPYGDPLEHLPEFLLKDYDDHDQENRKEALEHPGDHFEIELPGYEINTSENRDTADDKSSSGALRPNYAGVQNDRDQNDVDDLGKRYPSEQIPKRAVSHITELRCRKANHWQNTAVTGNTQFALPLFGRSRPIRGFAIVDRMINSESGRINGGGFFYRGGLMKRVRRASALFFLLSMLFFPSRHGALSQMIREPEEATRVVTVENVQVKNGTVTGEVHNLSRHTLRDVQILVRYTWLWNNEFKPGKDDPGASFYDTVPGEIPPGGSAKFTFSPSPPLPKRADGRFETTVSVAGFSEIIPQTR